MEIVLLIICIILLTMMSAFFSASETSLFSLSPITLKTYKHHKDKDKRRVARLLSGPRDLLVTILLMNIAVNILVQNTSSHLFGTLASWSLKVGIPLFLTLVFGEIIPKCIAIQHNAWIAQRVTPIIFFLRRLFRPLRKVITAITTYLYRLIFFFLKKEQCISKEELNHVLHTSKKSGLVDGNEAKLIDGYLSLQDSSVKEIMRPREDIILYKTKNPLSELISLFQNRECSRIPVSDSGLDGIKAMDYDGTPIELSREDIRETEIAARDIDRQNYPQYFLKEISESPGSVEQTILSRVSIRERDGKPCPEVVLDESVVPPALQEALRENRIQLIYVIGQGTAGIAAAGCAELLSVYLKGTNIRVAACKASEFSGFMADDYLKDALVVAISQSGTTTDTNRAVDMARERGAYTLAIVNRRDSDITFKVDGVLYTSTGRDIEMSVASTKAYYSQIAAGSILGLKLAGLVGAKGTDFIQTEIEHLLMLPSFMKEVLSRHREIGASAEKLALTKQYWAVVGSGPNKVSADEIRIKLSELCYKTISSDYVEDKKHIDLSSEPLIIVCAAGAKGTVIGDIIKDTAIFKAHKAAPVVIADEGEERFEPYAEDVFHVPQVSPQFAPILNTLVGHIWGYHAALAIHDGSRFLHEVRESIHATLDELAGQGLDVYEVVLEKTFREKIAGYYQAFRQRRKSSQFPAAITHASDLTLLFKYLAGRMPLADFEMDFGLKGTAKNVLDTLFRILGESINLMSRPVDAIKHQAKTVTVGTSRISERVEGVLFDALVDHELDIAQVVNRNVIVMKNIQGVIERVKGSILYRIDGLGLLGDPTTQTTIAILKKTGILAQLPSRVEQDPILKGTKRIIVREGNVYIGKGRKDDRSIVVIPATSEDPTDGSRIRYLLLLNIGFKEAIPLETKIKALGGKYEHIQNIVQENSVPWSDAYLDDVPVDDLFGRSAEKLAEAMVAMHR